MSTAIESGCHDCSFTGYVRAEKDGVSGVTVCHCVRERIARKAQFQDGGGLWPLPEILRDVTLKSFLLEKTTPSVRSGLEAAKRFAERPKGGLLFAGPPGTGKSHLAAGILKAVNVEAYFVGVPMLMRRLRETFNSAGESDTKIIDDLARVPLLVLDDLGAERSTGYVEETLYLIIDRRYSARKPVIYTTNKLVSESAGASELPDYLGDRTFSRVKGMCWNDELGHLNFFQMIGADRRYGR